MKECDHSSNFHYHSADNGHFGREFCNDLWMVLESISGGTRESARLWINLKESLRQQLQIRVRGTGTKFRQE